MQDPQRLRAGGQYGDPEPPQREGISLDQRCVGQPAGAQSGQAGGGLQCSSRQAHWTPSLQTPVAGSARLPI